MTKAQAQPGVPQLTCVSAIMVVSAFRHKKAIKSTPTASSFTWAVHVKEVTLEGSVIVKLMPAK